MTTAVREALEVERPEMVGEAGTWLADMRLGAGFDVSGLAAAIDVAPWTLRAWERGTRPSWIFVNRLAAALQVDVGDALQGLWGERPGDPCGCTVGCGGTRVEPADSPRALTLRTRRVCPGEDCSDVRIYFDLSAHRPLCSSCSRKKPKITLRCPDCEESREVSASRLSWMTTHPATRTPDGERVERRSYANAQVVWELGKGTARCHSCSMSDLVARRAARFGRDKRALMEHVRSAAPAPGEAIANLRELGLHQGEVLALEWSDVDFEGKILRVRGGRGTDPGRLIPLSPSAVGALRARRQRQNEVRGNAGDAWDTSHDLVFTNDRGRPLGLEAARRTNIGMVKSAEHRLNLGRAKLDPKHPTLGPFGWCDLCDKITFRGARFHRTCLQEWQRAHRGEDGRVAVPPPAPRRRGRPRLTGQALQERYELSVLYLQHLMASRVSPSHLRGRLREAAALTGDVLAERFGLGRPRTHQHDGKRPRPEASVVVAVQRFVEALPAGRLRDLLAPVGRSGASFEPSAE